MLLAIAGGGQDLRGLRSLRDLLRRVQVLPATRLSRPRKAEPVCSTQWLLYSGRSTQMVAGQQKKVPRSRDLVGRYLLLGRMTTWSAVTYREGQLASRNTRGTDDSCRPLRDRGIRFLGHTTTARVGPSSRVIIGPFQPLRSMGEGSPPGSISVALWGMVKIRPQRYSIVSHMSYPHQLVT